MTRFVDSFGMGTDSTALWLRWITDPGSRPCPLDELVMVTSMTGDEWEVTGELVAAHILPLMREHRVRWVQLARAGASKSDGVAVLSDTDSPEDVYLPGRYRLSQDLLAAGTVPQVGGPRRCSLNFKGWVIDRWLRDELAGEPYVHIMGYEADEKDRADKDTRQLGKLTRAPRTGAYPLIEWGWTRRDCEQFIYDILGVWWPKSACVQCPFALCSAAGPGRALGSYEAEPDSGVRALIMEHAAVAFNPRQTLAPGIRLLDLLVQTGRHQAALARYDEELTRLPWRIFEVRRAITAKRDGSGKKGRTVRSVRTVAITTRDGAPAELGAAATAAGARLTNEGGITRAWIHRRGNAVPTAEHHLVACPVTPDGPFDKDGPKFAEAWREALTATGADATLPMDWAS